MAIGDITGEISSVEFDTFFALHSNIIHVTGDVYAIAYTGDGHAGRLKTIEILSDGTITTPEIDSFEFDSYCSEPDIIHVAGDVYAIAYAGYSAVGRLKTIEILSDGTITTPEIDSFEFDSANGREPDIIHVAGDVYAIAYAGPGDDGWLKTIEILSDGTITQSEIDSFEFDSANGREPDIIHVAGDVYAIAYSGPGDDGWLKTVEILSNGAITTPEIDSVVFEVGVAGTDPRMVAVGGGVYAIAYSGGYGGCWLKTVEILSNGTINMIIDSHWCGYTWESASPWIIHLSGDIYAISYTGIPYKGRIVTVGIVTPAAAATSRHRFTGGMPHRALH